jgi:hypothetical protein
MLVDVDSFNFVDKSEIRFYTISCATSFLKKELIRPDSHWRGMLYTYKLTYYTY